MTEAQAPSRAVTGRIAEPQIIPNQDGRGAGFFTRVVRSRITMELLLISLGYLAYSQVRGLAGGRDAEAFANAAHIASLERSLGIFHELTVQQWFLSNETLISVFNYIYFYGFFPLIIPTAIWLLLRRPDVYRIARTAFLSSGAIAIVFFLTLPTAPPRLVDMGFVDTLTLSFTPTYSSIPGVNPYAALPSMHVGWTILLAVALYMALPRFRLRGVFFVIPFAMFSATIVTGNHWFLDAVLGAIVAAVGLWLALRLERYTEERKTPPVTGTRETSP